MFGFARWEKDRFSGYDQQFTAIAGYGRHLLDGERHRPLPGGRPRLSRRQHQRRRRQRPWRSPTALWTTVGRSPIRPASTRRSIEATDDNTTSRSLSAITARLNSRLALKLSHEIKHNSQPPESADARTDHTTSASLLYSW
ncbi:DUF481 domain-containing protein [Billgrantia gudaonensis]|uniref:DUF481 domain-containing protein n=1 Tax=Billgrantia gudaonensis TaxID=376427 RepID=A0A3S0QRH3_9GAMM|nr:DUF481 domain-containing protein [Halomonas gudaonensis]